jgi:hypothetical protein
MPHFLRSLLAAVAGLALGAATNMGLILLGAGLVPPPDGVDPTSAESIRANLHLFEPKHFLFPFLAHAAGTFDGAFVAAVLARPRGGWPPLAVGCLFLSGGIAMAVTIPAPAWFIVTDLVLAYVPMAILGSRLAVKQFGPRAVRPAP